MKNITTTEEFNSVIQSEQPVIVKFEAGWCPDCKAMDMWIDPIVDKYNDYKWYSVNRDELEDVASDNEVMGIQVYLYLKMVKNMPIYILLMQNHLNKLNHS